MRFLSPRPVDGRKKPGPCVVATVIRQRNPIIWLAENWPPAAPRQQPSRYRNFRSIVDEQTPGQTRLVSTRFATSKMRRRLARHAEAQENQHVMKLHHWLRPTKAARESYSSFFATSPLVFAAQIQGTKTGTMLNKIISLHELAKPDQLEPC